MREQRIALTGAIWQKPKKVRSQIIRSVCEKLEREYGMPRLGNPTDPLDDLIFIIISNKTSPKIAFNTYSNLKEEFSSWNEVIKSPSSIFTSILKPAGLANVKSGQIREGLKKISNDIGKCDLSILRGRSEKDIQDYLLSLPGVSEKVAKCVMLYTLNADVLPVDSHVHRITKRLGWTTRSRADQCHAELEALVPPKRRFAFHVDCIIHGRNICRPRNPNCERCCITRYCAYFQGLYKND